MAVRTVIVDCREGNVNSVQKMMDKIGHDTIITSSPLEIYNADKLILPGIGHFERAMEALIRYELVEPLNEAVLVKKRPVLGICLGMQLMAQRSEEGRCGGLGWMEGDVIRLDPASAEIKIPHMGWNTVTMKKPSRLMSDVEDGTEFYFAHAYRWRSGNPAEVICETNYGVCFPSAIEKENIFGVQFHPEKSHDGGLQLLRNFAAL